MTIHCHSLALSAHPSIFNYVNNSLTNYKAGMQYKESKYDYYTHPCFGNINEKKLNGMNTAAKSRN